LLRSHGHPKSTSHTSLSRHRGRTGHSPGCTYLS
jgi:hypothetical protein